MFNLYQEFVKTINKKVITQIILLIIIKVYSLKKRFEFIWYPNKTSSSIIKILKKTKKVGEEISPSSLSEVLHLLLKSYIHLSSYSPL